MDEISKVMAAAVRQERTTRYRSWLFLLVPLLAAGLFLGISMYTFSDLQNETEQLQQQKLKLQGDKAQLQSQIDGLGSKIKSLGDTQEDLLKFFDQFTSSANFAVFDKSIKWDEVKNYIK